MGGTTTTRSSKKVHKTYLQMVQNVQLTGFVPKIAQRESPIIGLLEEDTQRLHHPYDDALVVNIRVEDYNMHWVFVDNGNGRYPILPGVPVDGNWHRMIDSDERPAHQFWRNKGVPHGRGHIICNGRQLPLADHQGRNIPSGRLLVRLQCHPRMTHPQFVEGCNLNLPSND